MSGRGPDLSHRNKALRTLLARKRRRVLQRLVRQRRDLVPALVPQYAASVPAARSHEREESASTADWPCTMTCSAEHAVKHRKDRASCAYVHTRA
eukprot:2229391-Rhodomonas_salina.2